MADPLNDPEIEKQLALGERIRRSVLEGNQQALDMLLDAAERKIDIVSEQVLDDVTRELLKADPT